MKKKNNIIIGVIVALACVAAGVVGYIMLFKSSEEQNNKPQAQAQAQTKHKPSNHPNHPKPSLKTPSAQTAKDYDIHDMDKDYDIKTLKPKPGKEGFPIKGKKLDDTPFAVYHDYDIHDMDKDYDIKTLKPKPGKELEERFTIKGKKLDDRPFAVYDG
eukprot:GHVR01054977.1.p1 GENE.GHVR01054977.1~~GHVR01054977.1.p1  ORF type:complete len:158 (+),score=23.04 GHVR01054977.1:23-496(+)